MPGLFGLDRARTAASGRKHTRKTSGTKRRCKTAKQRNEGGDLTTGCCDFTVFVVNGRDQDQLTASIRFFCDPNCLWIASGDDGIGRDRAIGRRDSQIASHVTRVLREHESRRKKSERQTCQKNEVFHF